MDEMDMRMSSFARSHSNQSAFSVASSNDGSQAADRNSGNVSVPERDIPTHPWNQGQGGRDLRGQEQEQKQQQRQQQRMSTPFAESAHGVGSPPREPNFSRLLQPRGSFTTPHRAVDPFLSGGAYGGGSSGSGSGSGGGGDGGSGVVGARRRHSSYTYTVGSDQYTVDDHDDNDDDDDEAVCGRYSTPRQRHHSCSSRYLREDEEAGRFGGSGYASAGFGVGGAAMSAMSASSFSGARRVGGYSRPWCRSTSAVGAGSAAAAASAGASAAANQAGGAAGRGGGFANRGGAGMVGHARGLIYADEGGDGRGGGGGGGGRGGVLGHDSSEEGVRAGEDTDEEDDGDLVDGVFNMELF
eukprot:g13461.t1